MYTAILRNPVAPYPIKNNNISSVISCNWFENPERYGISNDRIIKVYNDHNNLQIKNATQLDDSLTLTYIQDTKSENELLNLLQVIAIFNQLNSAILNIYCDGYYFNILKDYSNEHIQFIKKNTDDGEEMPIETNVIITYGPGAIHFLKRGIAVVIIGPYGLGGWVTLDNFAYLLKSGFAGRPGGTIGEYIPVQILAHELLSIKECKDLSSVLIANKEYADNLPYKPLSAANEIIEEDNALQEQLHHRERRWELQPFVASNILFEQVGKTIAIKRKHIHDTLCTISQEDMSFFKAINGKANCKCLFKDFQMDEDDFWETLYSLNEKKIILF